MTGQPPPAVTGRTLADVQGVRVSEACCRAPAGPSGAEEAGELRRMVIPLQGVFSWSAYGESHIAEPGSAILLEPDEPYRFGHPVDGGDQCLVIALSPEVWAEVMPYAGLLTRPGRLVLDPKEVFHTMRFRTAAERRRDDPDAVRELAVLHLTDLAARHSGAHWHRRTMPASRRRAAHTAAAFVAAHYAEPIARLLDAAAAAAGCSPYHLARSFRAVHGVTLHAYRERLRTAAALHALAHGACDLARLATSLGYASHGHFTDRLRRAVGSPPSHLRTALCGAPS